MKVAAPGSEFGKVSLCHSGASFRLRYGEWSWDPHMMVNQLLGNHGNKHEIGPVVRLLVPSTYVETPLQTPFGPFCFSMPLALEDHQICSTYFFFLFCPQVLPTLDFSFFF